VLALAVSRVCNAGDAILFGTTRDGGALVVTVLSGEEREKWYPDDERSIGAALTQIADAYLPVGEKNSNGHYQKEVG